MKPAAASRGALWALPAALFLGAFVVWPVFQLARLSLCRGGGQNGFGIGRRLSEPGTWTPANYTALLHESYCWELLGFTVWLGFVVTAICLVLGYPVAHCIWNLRGRWKLAAIAAVIVPKLSNLLVTVYGLKLILGDHGPVNELLLALHFINRPILLHQSTAGVVIGKTCLVLP